MKKFIISGILAITFLSSASALTWSGLIDNNSKLSSNHNFSDLNLNQSNGIYLSLASNLNKSGSMRFTAEGLYKYNLAVNLKSGNTSFSNIADIDLLKFSGDWNLGGGSLSVNLGRFQYSDFSGVVFSQVSDGAYISFNTLKTKTSIYAGYTGLLNRFNVSMTDTLSIIEDKNKDAQWYDFCPMYIPVAADFSYKALFGTNTLGLQGAAFIPLSDKYTLKGYGTIVLSGYLGTIGSYDARFTAGTEKFESLMLNGKLDLNFYLGKSTMLTAGGEYASGKTGDIKPFLTITSRAFGNAPFTNGVIVPKLGLMYASGSFYGCFTERVVLAMPENEVKLEGFDSSLNLIYNLFSDVQIGCDLGAYICTETKESSFYFATLKASLSF